MLIWIQQVSWPNRLTLTPSLFYPAKITKKRPLAGAKEGRKGHSEAMCSLVRRLNISQTKVWWRLWWKRRVDRRWGEDGRNKTKVKSLAWWLFLADMWRFWNSNQMPHMENSVTYEPKMISSSVLAFFSFPLTFDNQAMRVNQRQTRIIGETRRSHWCLPYILLAVDLQCGSFDRRIINAVTTTADWPVLDRTLLGSPVSSPLLDPHYASLEIIDRIVLLVAWNIGHKDIVLVDKGLLRRRRVLTFRMHHLGELRQMLSVWVSLRVDMWSAFRTKAFSVGRPESSSASCANLF
jgi:hypothetical protein